MARFRIAADVHARIDSTADWCAEHMRPHLPALLATLRQSPANVRSLTAAVPGTALARAFEAAAADESCWALPDEVVFPRSPFPLRAHFAKHDRGISLTLPDPESWARLAELFIDREADSEGSKEEIGRQLARQGFLEGVADNPVSRRSLCPGIYRLQHAAALIVGEEARILIDPVHFIDRTDPVRPETIGSVDAILLSHGHNDHVCPLSLAHHPRDTPILLYDSLGGSMLCTDIAAILRAAGFANVQVKAPGESARFGDILVTARAFVGEQPWLSRSSPDPRLRAHGRTWLVEMAGCRIWFLADSGVEYRESMLDEAKQVAEEHGPVDVIAGNLQEFRWFPGQIDGSGRYLFCFPLPTLLAPREWPVGKLMTLGPEGAGELARIVGARALLAHAHWFHQPGAPIDTEQRPLKRAAAVRRVAGGKLATPAWRVGDSISMRRDRSVKLFRNAFNWTH